MHSEIVGDKNQTGNLIKNVSAFRVTCLGTRPEMVIQVIGPEENQSACTLPRFPSVSANALILKVSVFTLVETRGNTFQRVKQ